MTSETSPYDAPPAPAATSRAWSGADLAIGSALIVVLISLFLPWFSQTVHLGPASVSGTTDGVDAHGYLWVVFIIAIIGLAVLVARDELAKVPGNLPSAEQLFVLTTGLALLLTILGVVFKPAGYIASGSLTASVSVGWSYGGFVAVAAAAIAFLAAWGMTGRLLTASRLAPTA